MRWELAAEDPIRVQALAAALRDLHDLPISNRARSATGPGSPLHTLARLLVRRGLTAPDDAARFLIPSITHLHAPEEMTGLRAAVDRIDAAIERKDPILIYGDYDVDGTMAIIILKTAIELCGGAADFHVPHRIREGYDLRDDVIENAAAAGIRLIISVDMGIRAFAPAETAQRLASISSSPIITYPGRTACPGHWRWSIPIRRGASIPVSSFAGLGLRSKWRRD